MIRHRVVFTFLLLIIGGRATSQQKFIVKKDLQQEWLIYTGNSYTAFSNLENPVTTIYFSVKPKEHRGDYLRVATIHPFSLMLNGRLIMDQRETAILSIDSLSKQYPSSVFFFAVHSRRKINVTDLTTHVGSKALQNRTRDEDTPTLKRETFFRDFAVTSLLVLFIFLIGIIRLNPRLSSDYFSVTKIFSLRDSEGDQFYYRLTSSSMLFYVFTSVLLAFYLLVISQFTETEISASRLNGYPGSLMAWLKISLIIFVFLLLKRLLIYTITSLFAIRSIAGFHFFNFIRLLLVLMGALTLILSAYFVLNGQQKGFYNFFYELLTWILGGWVILLFLKLINRGESSVFHLFSYICATEIIPFLLIVKILNE